MPAMRLREIAARAGARPVDSHRDTDVVVTGVSLDSRRVSPGDLYAALPGAHAHGARFAAAAVHAGAVAVLTDPAGHASVAALRPALPVPVLAVEDPRAVLGHLSAAVYGEPARRLNTVAVTGTNGKTTTSYLLEGALRWLGRRAGLIGTVGVRIAGQLRPSVHTTPESPDLQRLLADMVDHQVDTVAMEVSSHALALHRVDGIVFTLAGFTNLSQDHLDFHPDMDDYFAVKASLFTADRARHGVVVVDDEYGRRLAATAGIPLTTIAATVPSAGGPPAGSGAHWQVTDATPHTDGSIAVTAAGPDGSVHQLTCPLPGSFNVANLMLAFVLLTKLGVPAADAATALAQVEGVPGRMQRVVGRACTTPGDQPLAVVDFAHTPDALAAALTALRPATPGRLVVVFGAGGDRDPGKRAGMGRVAAEHADVVVVTDDNPRTEDPATIRAAVLAGARSAGTDAVIEEVPGRARAIEVALSEVNGPADTVIVAGKGHEQTQTFAWGAEPFDDSEVLSRLLRQRTEQKGQRSWCH